MRTRLLHIAAALVLVASLPACTSWRALPAAEIGAAGDERPGTVRFLSADGQEIVLRRPYVDGDSLRGVWDGQPAGFALMDVQAAESKETNEIKTIGAVYGGLAVVGIIYITIAAAFAVGDAVVSL